MSGPLRPPLNNTRVQVRPAIAEWYREPEPVEPAPQYVKSLRLTIAPEGGFILAVGANTATEEHPFEICNVDDLQNYFLMRRVVYDACRLDLSCASVFWRKFVVPRLLSDATEGDEATFTLRTPSDARTAA